ncbi:MAG: coenzyme F420-0:L-glutamate ligase, partial [Schwartzia sp.]|nr:coenzyme F420-0:L-glutamate ligase [Schwartzia sp. (in: firmicutes)]
MPIFKEGDDLVSLIRDGLVKAAKEEGFELQDRDVLGVTEAVVARTQGNYATVQQIAKDVRQKLGGEDMGIVFPIL